jgi:hypothetical protein
MPESLGYDVVVTSTGRSPPVLASAPVTGELHRLCERLGNSVSFEQISVLNEILSIPESGKDVYLVEGAAGVGKSTMIRSMQDVKGDEVQVSCLGPLKSKLTWESWRLLGQPLNFFFLQLLIGCLLYQPTGDGVHQWPDSSLGLRYDTDESEVGQE